MDNKQIYQHIISLGWRCHTSSTLKSLNLKKYSCPFDWIFSNLDMIQDCLEDNFKKFLDKSLYIDNPTYKTNGENKGGHKIYGSNIFNHHNPKLKEDYNYYLRCVERFTKLLQSKETKIYIHMINMGNNNLNLEDLNIKILKINNTLSKLTENYKLLIILYHEIHDEKKVIIEKENNNLIIVNLYVESYSIGTRFKDQDDEEFFKEFIKCYVFNFSAYLHIKLLR
jgi:hypothetical protein